MSENIPDKKYDFIFLGAGCAALSLLMRMIRSNKFSDKNILLIDKVLKIKNDRTWCFWEKDRGFFEEIVYRRWGSLNFYSQDFSSALDISPYQYKMIRGIDFYDYCFREIKKNNNIDLVYAVINREHYKERITIYADNKPLNVGHALVFNSIPIEEEKEKKEIHLLQHFKGWIIETKRASFIPATATLMDFRVRQNNGTAFGYILPFDERSAMIEYTLFTDKLLKPQEYDEELKNYIENILKINDYRICDEELGSIPMTNKKFNFYNCGVWNIGTAGGQTKASSGYTFQFIQKQSKRITDYLIQDKSLHTITVDPKRFNFYDTVLLRLLAERRLSADTIFSRLFQRNKASAVFKFLDNETSPAEELKLISTLPVFPFLKAALR